MLTARTGSGEPNLGGSLMLESIAAAVIGGVPINMYRVSDEAASAVFSATAGQPRLVQRFGAALYEFHEVADTPQPSLTLKMSKLSPPPSRSKATRLPKDVDESGRNERLVLTAMTRLMYADPLTPVTISAIAEWLIESDYPLDLTTINAIRGLEYDELIDNTKAGITYVLA